MNSSHTEKEQYWSRFAEDFEERNTYVVGKTNLDIVYDKLSKERNLGNLLELACGNGTYTKIINKNADRIITTDYSDEMVSAACSRLKSFENVSVKKENCFSLSFKNNTFDTVFMANLIHVIPTPEKALQECLRVLKPGGQLIILSFTSEEVNFINKMLMIYRYMKSYGKPSPTAYTLTKSIAVNIVQNAGFAIHNCELIGKSMKAIYLNATKTAT